MMGMLTLGLTKGITLEAHLCTHPWVSPGSFSWGIKMQFPGMSLVLGWINGGGEGKSTEHQPSFFYMSIIPVDTMWLAVWPSCVTHLPYYDSLYPQIVSQSKCSPLIFCPPFTFFLKFWDRFSLSYPLALASEESRTTGLGYQECEFGYIMHSSAIVSTQSAVMRRLT